MPDDDLNVYCQRLQEAAKKVDLKIEGCMAIQFLTVGGYYLFIYMLVYLKIFYDLSYPTRQRFYNSK